MSYETFDHTADLGLRVRAASLPELLAEAARGLFSIIVKDVSSIQPVQAETFRIVGTSPDYLLFDWLTELLYAFDTKQMLFSDFEISLDAEGLSARASGEPFDPARHTLEHEVKAVTYHALRVEQQHDAWIAELIVDI